MDVIVGGYNSELIYESAICGWNSSQTRFCWECWDGGIDFEYSMFCGKRSNHVFGSVGIHSGEYIILNKFTDTQNSEKQKNVEHQYSYIEAYPKTGRTHQIRVHMRYINHPVVSDPLYRGAKELSLGMKRLALHANSITFSLPSGEVKTVESPLPADFKKVIKTYIDIK